MAIQFGRAEFVSRSQGKNACCKSAYNARECIVDEKTGVTYDFTRLKDNAYHEILLPEHVDKKFKSAAELSNEVERKEKRKNSQLYKEYVLALPDDEIITLEDKIEITKRFVASKKFVEEGLGVQIDIHTPHDGEKNWHAHLLVTTRRFTEDGLSLGAKARDLGIEVRGGKNPYGIYSESEDNGLLVKDIQNQYFKEKNIDLVVDEVSETPGVHLGPVRMRGLMQEAIQFNQERRVKAPELIQTGDDLLDIITETQAVFDEEDLEKAFDHISNSSLKNILIKNALESSRICHLYQQDEKAVDLYTTLEVRREEERLLRIADKIANSDASSELRYDKDWSDSLVNSGRLSASQGEAANYLIGKNNASSLRILQGRAGAGKSYVLAALRDGIIAKDRHVIGLAPTHKAVNELKNKGFEVADTVKGFLFKYRNGKVDVPAGTQFIVDESGMLGTSTTLELLKIIRGTKAELILAGDEKQLTSIERGGAFEVLAKRYGCYTLNEIKRQQNEWGIKVSDAFAKGNILDGIKVLEENQRLIFSSDSKYAMTNLLSDWSKSNSALEDRLILAISNKSVDALNKGAREVLKSQGELHGTEYEIENKSTRGTFSAGDRIVITETNKSQSLQNGDFGKITSINTSEMVVSFDNGKQSVVNPVKISFKHGYAVTDFKSQGASVHDVYVYHSGFSTKNNSYVEMSRHVKDLHLYCNHKATKGIDALEEQFAKVLDKGSSLNYKTLEDMQDKDTSLLGSIKDWVKDKTQAMGDKLHQNHDYYIFEEKHYVNSIKVKEAIEESNIEFKQAVGAEDMFVYCPTKEVSNQSEASTSNLAQDASLTTTNGANKHQAWNNDVAKVRHNLKMQAERVAYDLLGTPNKSLSNGQILRFGEHGKLAVEVSGDKSGLWHDFAKGVGGDMLALIGQEKGLDFKDSLEFAKSYHDSTTVPDIIQDKYLRQVAKTINSQEKLERLQKLYARSKAITAEHAIAKSHLEGECGIELINIPEDVRFVADLWNSDVRKNLPAIVSFARNHDGEIKAVNTVYLNPESKEKIREATSQRSFGKVSGSYVEIQSANLGVTIITKDVETALSLKQAQVPGKIIAAMEVHNFKNYEPANGEKIIIAADNHGDNNTTTKSIENAYNILTDKCTDVEVIYPDNPRSFNDVLKEQGYSAVYLSFKGELAKSLSQDWLDVWEKGERSLLSAKDMLANTDGSELKDIYKENYQCRSEGFDVFLADKSKEFAHLSNLDATYDIKLLQKELLHLDECSRESYLSNAISKHEIILQENQERASTPYNLTKKEFSLIVNDKLKEIHDGFHGTRKFVKDPSLGVKDFHGNNYRNQAEYLSALGNDKALHPLIDDNTSAGKQIQEQLAKEHRKIEVEQQQKLEIARQIASTPYNITKKEFESIVQGNLKELKAGYRGDMKFLKDPDWGVKDFKGNNYRTKDAYLSSLGKDKALQPLIEKESALYKQISESQAIEMRLEQSREDGRGL